MTAIFAGLDELKQGNAELARRLKESESGFSVRLSEKDRELFEERREYDELAEQYDKQLDFLNSIPTPLYNNLAWQYNELRRREREREEYEYGDDD